MILAMITDTLDLFKSKDADSVRWERFLSSHKEFIHAKDFTRERKGTHIHFENDRQGVGGKVVYE